MTEDLDRDVPMDPRLPRTADAGEEIQDPEPMELWVEERHRDIFSTKFRVENVLFSGESPFQKVEVVQTVGFGRMLLNDGMVMLSERDEFIYHDMISHIPLFVHPKPERVLVIGGGDGGTAREVLRHPGVKHCRMVEIDEMVVEACREFIPQTAACLDDPRLTLSIDDGVKFVAETAERYDVVLVDSTDPVGPAAPLFGNEFYGNVHRVLADDGIVISQGGSPFLEMETLRSILRIQNELFAHTHAYTYSNLTYPAGYWSFTYASKGLCPIRDFRKEAVRESGLRFDYYTPGIHTAAFSLPEFVRRELGEWLSPCP